MSVAYTPSWSERPVGCGDGCRLVRYVEPASARLALGWLHDLDQHDRACVRCRSPLAGVVALDDLEIDTDRHEVRAAGRRVHVTRREWQLIVRLASSPGQLVRYEDFALAMGDNWIVSDLEPLRHVVRIHLARVRGKLPSFGRRLHNVLGRGYILDDREPLP